MPRWSTRTLLRELREFKKEQKLEGTETIDSVIGSLESKFIEEEMDKALKPSKPKKVADGGE